MISKLDRSNVMPVLTVKRLYLDNVTLSVTRFGDFQCVSLELPDLDNQSRISCIPEGEYTAFKRVSGRNGNVFQLEDVPGRSYIQGHSGNYTSQIQGCIVFGDAIKDINHDGILDVSNSKNTLSKLMALLPERFKIKIMS